MLYRLLTTVGAYLKQIWRMLRHPLLFYREAVLEDRGAVDRLTAGVAAAYGVALGLFIKISGFETDSPTWSTVLILFETPFFGEIISFAAFYLIFQIYGGMAAIVLLSGLSFDKRVVARDVFAMIIAQFSILYPVFIAIFGLAVFLAQRVFGVSILFSIGPADGLSVLVFAAPLVVSGVTVARILTSVYGLPFWEAVLTPLTFLVAGLAAWALL